MARTPGLTQADIENRWRRIEQLSRQGCSVAYICEELGVSRATVFAARRRAGIATCQRRLTADEVRQADAMLAGGCSLAETARTFGVSRSAIWKRFPGRGWTRQQVGEWSALVTELRQRGRAL